MELKLINGKTEIRPWGAALCGIGFTGIELRQQDFASLQHWPGEQVKEYLTQVIHPRFAAPSQPVPKGPVCWTGTPDESQAAVPGLVGATPVYPAQELAGAPEEAPAAVSGAEGEPVPLVAMRDEELRGVDVSELRERALFRLAALGVEIQSDGRLTDLPPAFQQLATMINELADRGQTADNKGLLQSAGDRPSSSHGELADARNQVNQLKRNLAECRENVSRLKADRDHYRSKTAHLQEDLQEYRERVGALTANLGARSETDPVQPPPRFTVTDRDTLAWVRKNGRALEELVRQHSLVRQRARGEVRETTPTSTCVPHEAAEHIRRLSRQMVDVGIFGRQHRVTLRKEILAHLSDLESCAVKYYDL